MRWSDIIIDKQNDEEIKNNAAMMGIAYEDDIEALQKKDLEVERSGTHGAHGQAPVTGKSKGDTVSVDSFSKGS